MNLCLCKMYIEQPFRTNVRGEIMRKRYVVVSKGRYYLFIILIFMIVTVVIMSLLSSNKVYGKIYEHDYDYDEVKIREGDTLWMIATDYVSQEYDVRRMVYEIKRFNKMEESYIYVGDILKIPIMNEK